MQGIIKTKSFKIVSLLLVAAICVTAFLWNPLQAHAVEIGDVNAQGYSLLSSGSGTSTPVTPGSFGMFFATRDNTDDERFNASNLKWTYADSKWSPETKLLWANSSAEADVYAYYPYNENVNNMNAIPWTVQADQSSGTDSSDILRYSGTAQYSAENARLNIAFNHAGTKLVVDLSDFGTEIDATATVSTVTLSKVELGGTLDLTNGTWSLSGTSAAVTMYYNGTAKTAECILPPQTINELTVTVTISDGSTYVFNAASAVNVAAGYQYTMAVQVGQDVINMGTISITDWNAVKGGKLETN